MIRLSGRSWSYEEAAKFIKDPNQDVPDLQNVHIGVLRALRQHAPGMAKEVAEYILQQGGVYCRKIENIASDIIAQEKARNSTGLG